MKLTQTGPSDRFTRWLPLPLSPLLALALLATLAGCDEMNRLFNNSLLDQTAVGRYQRTVGTIGLRRQISLNDEEYGVIPKDALDPQPGDLVVRREDYRIVPGDQLLVRVYELLAQGREEQIPLMVSETGYISLPRLPRLFVAGKTEGEIQEQIASAYQEAGILRTPQVTVVAQTRFNRRCYFLGNWRTPGAFTIPSVDFRLLSGLGMVGDVADTTVDTIYIVRTEGQELIKPGAAEGGPGVESGPGSQPAPLPGGEPAPLPGGPANGTGQTPAKPSSVLDVPKDLQINPERPGPATTGQPPSQPLVNHTGVPEAAPKADRGHWMMVGNKWTFVQEPAAQPAAGNQGEGGNRVVVGEPVTRKIRIPLPQLRAGEPRYNVVLRPEDVIVAPQPVIGEFYVMGNVARPGVYSLSGRQITLVQAIAAAGGFGPLADPSKIQLIRRIRGGERAETVSFDYGAIIEARCEDIVLQPYDTINVGSNPLTPFLAVLRNAFRATYGVGFVYDRNFADIDSFSPRANPRG